VLHAPLLRSRDPGDRDQTEWGRAGNHGAPGADVGGTRAAREGAAEGETHPRTGRVTMRSKPYYEPLPRLRQQLPFKHPVTRAWWRCALAWWLAAVLLGVGGWLVTAHAGQIILGDPAGAAATRSQQETYDYIQRQWFHEDHEADRRVYGVNPPGPE